VNIGVQHDEDGRAEGAKYIDVVVDGEGVYFLDASSGAMHIIDGSIAVKPAITNTWFIKFVKLAFQKAIPKPSPKVEQGETSVPQDGSLSESSESGASTTRSEGEKLAKHKPAVKAGGKRRRAGRK
jgi:hypothetical protein